MRTGKIPTWAMSVVWIASIALSVLVRGQGLSGTSYMWRPMHTELTSFWFEREGIDLLNYETPLLGPPWTIPIEFPLFQAMTGVIYRAGLNDNELASRLSALLCFYVSACFMFLVCRKIFTGRLVTFAAVNLYLWMPYNIYYSTESYIDFLSLAMTLAYLLFILLWLEAPSSLAWVIGAVISGSLGVLVKPTTVPIVAIPILVFVIEDLHARYRQELRWPPDLPAILTRSWRLRWYWLALMCMAAIPAITGAAWTRHTDQLKDQSIQTQFLRSGELVTWYFGTWDLRGDPNMWLERGAAIQKYFSPHGLTIFVVFGLLVAASAIKTPGTERRACLFVMSIFTSMVLVLFIFLALYFVHDYYYMALSASMAILGAFGLVSFWQVAPQHRRILGLVLAIWAMFFIMGSIRDYNGFRALAAKESAGMARARSWAASVQEVIPEDSWIAVIEISWQPHVPYVLERKALIVSNKNHMLPLCPTLRDERFGYVILSRLEDTYRPENENRLKKVLECFASYYEIMPDVYKVEH